VYPDRITYQRAQPAVARLGKGGTILKEIILLKPGASSSQVELFRSRVLEERVSGRVRAFGNFGSPCTQRVEVGQNAVFREHGLCGLPKYSGTHVPIQWTTRFDVLLTGLTCPFAIFTNSSRTVSYVGWPVKNPKV
jgi:hypothetical protein